jgi:cell filamentation protein
MNDPYLYKGTETLKNLFNIEDDELLEAIEADYTGFRIKELAVKPLDGEFDFFHLCDIHKYIFQDLFEWAGVPRIINISKAERVLGGLSVQYSDVFAVSTDAMSVIRTMNDTNWTSLEKETRAKKYSHCIASLWRVHPFREGNTRTIITFCVDFAEDKGFPLNREMFAENSEYVRTALVAASAIIDGHGDISKPDYIENFIIDAMI